MRVGRAQLVVVGLLVLSGAPALVAPVDAECDGPYPSFREVAPGAERVVVGQVVATRPSDWGTDDLRSSRFTLQAWSLKDGLGPFSLDVDDVRSQPCAGDLVAAVGDQVAIAFDGRAFSTAVRANAIAWISGQPPDLAGVEVVSLPQIYELLQLPMPAAIPLQAGALAEPSAVPWPAVGAGIVVLLVTIGVLFRAAR